MPRYRMQQLRGYKKIQVIRRGTAYAQDHYARSKGSQDGVTRKHRRAARGLPQEGHRLSRLRISLEQFARGVIKGAGGDFQYSYEEAGVSDAQGSRLSACSGYRT